MGNSRCLLFSLPKFKPTLTMASLPFSGRFDFFRNLNAGTAPSGTFTAILNNNKPEQRVAVGFEKTGTYPMPRQPLMYSSGDVSSFELWTNIVVVSDQGATAFLHNVAAKPNDKHFAIDQLPIRHGDLVISLYKCDVEKPTEPSVVIYRGRYWYESAIAAKCVGRLSPISVADAVVVSPDPRTPQAPPPSQDPQWDEQQSISSGENSEPRY